MLFLKKYVALDSPQPPERGPRLRRSLAFNGLDAFNQLTGGMGQRITAIRQVRRTIAFGDDSDESIPPCPAPHGFRNSNEPFELDEDARDGYTQDILITNTQLAANQYQGLPTTSSVDAEFDQKLSELTESGYLSDIISSRLDIRAARCQIVGVSNKGRRLDNQDYHIHRAIKLTISGKEIDGVVMGVLDGHGGDAIAKFVGGGLAHQDQCGPALAERIEAQLAMLETLAPDSVANAIHRAFMDMDAAILQAIQEQKLPMHCGTTACVSVLIENNLYCANLGDTRAVLINTVDSSVEQLSFEHPLSSPYSREYCRIQALGGSLVYDEGYRIMSREKTQTLNVPRALGDFDYTPNKAIGAGKGKIVSACPTITWRALSVDKIHQYRLAIVCDGIHQRVSNDAVAHWVVSSDTLGVEAVAHRLIQYAAYKKSTDNCTALVAKFDS